MIVRLFDPQGIDPRDYKGRYSELEDTPEFAEVNGRKLIFIWWYANPTSPIIGIVDNKDRAKEAIKLSQWRPSKTEKSKLEEAVFDDATDKAIDRMGSFEPGARYISWMLVKDMFDQYQTILEGGMENFTKTIFDKEGKDTGKKIVDYKGYVSTTKDITEQLPILIDKLEKGFGISVIKKGTGDTEFEEQSLIRSWNLDKQRDR